MYIVAVLIAKLLDPVGAIVGFIVVQFSREKWIIPVAAAVEAVGAETLLASMQALRPWGQGILPGFLAGLVHASLAYLITNKFRSRNAQKEGTASD